VNKGARYYRLINILFLFLNIIKRNCIVSSEIKYYFISRRQGLTLCFTLTTLNKVTLFH